MVSALFGACAGSKTARLAIGEAAGEREGEGGRYRGAVEACACALSGVEGARVVLRAGAGLACKMGEGGRSRVAAACGCTDSVCCAG